MDSIPTGFLDYLTQHYNEGEIRTLCFDLGIDYDSLPAVGKADKARELITYCARFGRMNELVTAAQRGRPAYTPPAPAPTTTAQPTSRSTISLDRSSCFISYSHQDEAFAQRLHERLQATGLRVWYAPENIQGGQKLHEQINQAIQEHDRLLVVLSDASLASEWVATEIRRARKIEQSQKVRKLFPIRLTSMDTLKAWECFDADTGKDLGVELREYFIPDFSNWQDLNAFENAFDRLYRDLKASAHSA